VVFAKIVSHDRQNPLVKASPNLRRLWHAVMDDYESIDRHQNFLAACQKEDNLIFASNQYGKILEVYSGDEMAVRMQNEIVTLAQVPAQTHGSSSPASLNWTRWLPRLSILFLGFGGAFIATGFLFASTRNLIGLGAAIVFCTVAAGWFSRR